MSMEDKMSEIIADFAYISSDSDRLEVMMEYGEELVKPDYEFSNDERVPGCASEVFVHVNNNASGKVSFTMWSSSLIIKGYCVLLKQLFDGEDKNVILESEEIIKQFIVETRLDASLIPSRTNSFERLYQFMLQSVKNF